MISYGFLIATRSDLIHAVNFLNQFKNNPVKPLWIAEAWVIIYLKSTQDQGLIFKHDAKFLIALVNADCASDVNGRISYSCLTLTLHMPEMLYIGNK